MKNRKISLKTVTLTILIGIIISLILIILNINNKNIIQQEISKKQLVETTDNSYVAMQSHLSEINKQEEKLVSFKTKIAEAITNQGIETNANDTIEIMSNNIANIVTEVTKNATATADNISKGKTAWVNGKLITGNGADNEIYEASGKPIYHGNKTATLDYSIMKNVIYLTDIPNYQNLVLYETLWPVATSVSYYQTNGSFTTNVTYSYDASTGMLAFIGTCMNGGGSIDIYYCPQ